MKIFSTVRHDFVNDQCVVSVAVLLNCSRRVVPKILIQYLVGGGGEFRNISDILRSGVPHGM